MLGAKTIALITRIDAMEDFEPDNPRLPEMKQELLDTIAAWEWPRGPLGQAELEMIEEETKVARAMYQKMNSLAGPTPAL